MNEKIHSLAMKAYAKEQIEEHGSFDRTDIAEILLTDMHQVFVEFAKLVAEDCAMIAYRTSDIDGDCCANSILFEYDVDNCRSEK